MKAARKVALLFTFLLMSLFAVSVANANSVIIDAPAAAVTGTPFTINVDIVDDTQSETGDAFSLSSSDPAATGTTSDVSPYSGSFTFGTAGTQTITVTDSVDGTTSTVTINVAQGGPPLTALSPTSATAGGPAFTLTLTGSDFASGATVNFNGQTLTPSAVSTDGTQITVTVPAADIATAGIVSVTVTNPAGGGISNALTFTINNPVPTLTSISPPSVTAGGPDLTLTLAGTNFVGASTVNFNGQTLTPSAVTATQITVTVPAADIATGRIIPVTVTNPAPGGGTSGAVNFTVNNPVPTLTSISPTSATAGGPDFTLTLTGTNFVSASTVSFNGQTLTPDPSAITATQITVTVPAADIATGGIVPVTVNNPAPGGGTSSPQTFTIYASVPPLSVSIQPGTVVGTNPAVGTVTLAGPAPPAGETVTLSSDTPAAAAVPLTLQIAAGATTGTFPVTTQSVAASANVTISAQAAGVTQTAMLTVLPPSVQTLTLTPSSVTAGAQASGSVTLNVAAPAGGATVTLSSDNPAASVPTSVVVPAGKLTVPFTVTANAVSATTTANITATYNGTQTAALTVQPTVLAGLTLNPGSVLSGQSSTGTVTLATPATPGGVTVMLSSSDPAAAPPAKVTVLAGATTATFTVNTNPVASATTTTVTAALNGSTAMAPLTVNPLGVSGLSLNPTSVVAGSPSQGTVTLNGPAPAGGLTVSLSSDNGAATVPATVVVAANATSATFPVSTGQVGAVTTANIGAATGQLKAAAALTIQPLLLQSVTLNPTSVLAGSQATGTVTLTAPAPAGGLTVSLSSSNAAASVPTSVTVAASSTTAQFTVTTGAVSAPVTATVTGGLNGSAQTAALTVNPNGLVSLSLDPSTAPSGSSVTGTVALSGPAPAGGQAVSLSSADPSLAPVPPSVTVPAGQASASFTFTAGAAVGTATVRLTASESGTSQGATLTVQGVTLKSLSFSPAQVRAGQPSAGTVTLSGPAPAGGATVTLTSGNKAVAVPATVTVPGGSSSVTFSASTGAVSSAITVGVTATVAGGTAQGQLTVTPVPGTVFGSGLRMISVPMDYPGVPLDQLLGAGARLYRWDPSALMYAVSPNAPADEVRLGRGYWLRSPGGVTVSRQGTPADTTRDFTIGLEKGWNQIGDPFFSSVPLSSLRVSSGGLGQAGSAINSPFYAYNPPANGVPGQYQVAGSLDPGQGYWVHATAPTTLTVPHP